MLEDAVAIAKATLLGTELLFPPAGQFDCAQALEAFTQFDAVGTDILHRACADAARNQCQVLQSTQALIQGPAYKGIPALAGLCFDDHLLAIVKRDRKWNDDGARKQLVTFFEAWGPADPATLEGRKKLSSILFS